jgi:F-type H+-transporting ATPase subunit b
MGGPAAADTMHLDLWTLLLQAINLAVLLALLRWLLYKPLMAVIDKRQQRIGEELAAAKAERQKAEQESQALTAQRAAIDTTRDETLSEARQSAESERLELLASAKAAIQGEQAEARQQLGKERELASQALMNEASSLAVDLATRLIGSSPAPLGDREFIDALLEHLKATPAQDRERWLGSTQPTPVKLVCATTPSETTLQKVKDQLAQTLNTEIDLQPETQPSLLRGAELHFEHGVLSQSWSAELAAARSEMHQAPL